ncbi:hypothetical protein [Candidatus Clostridium radicumherbarum]|uniref:MotA/TolQ/ExbB proton channel domain-containing protein n=1 Tax=Candidatus Clostridium radicumherbarum TaxID=3381662 RepID=A0ABW8TSJ8_9CLOT
MFTTICSALSILLTTAVLVLLVKKLIIGFNDRYTGVIILLALALGIISIFCSAIGGFGAIKLDLMFLPSNEIAKIKNQNIIAFVIGYVSLTLNYAILKIIERKNKKEQPKQEKHWDL